MFYLQPPRHISTLRISPVAECPDQGPLTEPAADARPRGWGLIFLPHSSHPCSSGGSSALGFKAVIYSLPPIGGDVPQPDLSPAQTGTREPERTAAAKSPTALIGQWVATSRRHAPYCR